MNTYSILKRGPQEKKWELVQSGMNADQAHDFLMTMGSSEDGDYNPSTLTAEFYIGNDRYQYRADPEQ